MTFASEILADSPLGFWKLDETSGTTATDSSGNGRHGTYTTSGMVGTGGAPCSLSGVTPTFSLTDYVTAPSDAAWSMASTLTVEALVRRDASTTSPVGPIVSHDMILPIDVVLGDAPANDCYNVYALSNGVEIESNNRTPYLDGLLSCNYDGKWAHVIVTKSGTGSTGTNIYINGSLVATGACADFETGTRPLLIGRRGYPTLPLEGNLSHVAIYSTVLSASRVAAHWAEIACPTLCPCGLVVGFMSLC